MAPFSSSSALTQAVNERLGSIVPGWLARLRAETPASRGLSDEVLVGRAPALLRNLAATFTAPGDLLLFKDARENAKAHGIARARSAYTVSNVVSDYIFLREVLIAELKYEPTKAELLSLSRFFETCIGAAVESFTEARQRRHADEDVTERLRASEIAMRDAKERAELANAAKSSFLANMSHEIRTPLGAIMGFVSLIKDEGASAQTIAGYISVIERNSTQLMRIIDDILDLSKVEAGMMLIEHIDFSLIELLSDFASLMGFRAREKGVLFELKASTELPDIVNSDPTRTRQILTNIVGNAIKFTDRGSVVLTVSYDAGGLRFEVSDTGRGISEEQRAKLFQPFAQGDPSTTRKYGGTGLGLVLTRRLSEALGGSFELVSSRPGEGSTFAARIGIRRPGHSRLVRALGLASEEPLRNAGAQGPFRGRLQDVRILLVEDSPDNQALFSIYLNRAGAKIDIASDGQRGVEMALTEGYDVVLMDVQMPIMDGLTAVRKLRSSGYETPIIALTAHAMKEEKIRCLDAGYSGFLSKPIQRAELVDALVKYRRES